MTIHAEVVTMLATLNAAFPDVTSYEPSKLRALLRNRRAPLERLPDMRSVEDLAIDGPGGDLSIRVYRPHTSSDAIPLVVFAHGGGFVFCDLDSHDEFCRSMAQGVGAVVVSVDYRLAPEHSAPAAHDDVFAAVEWAAKHAAEYGADPSKIVLAGDSAGGNLAATVAIAARDRGGPEVAAQVLIYPVIDDDFDTESYRLYGTDHYNTTTAMKWYWGPICARAPRRRAGDTNSGRVVRRSSSRRCRDSRAGSAVLVRRRVRETACLGRRPSAASSLRRAVSRFPHYSVVVAHGTGATESLGDDPRGVSRHSIGFLRSIRRRYDRFCPEQ